VVVKYPAQNDVTTPTSVVWDVRRLSMNSTARLGLLWPLELRLSGQVIHALDYASARFLSDKRTRR